MSVQRLGKSLRMTSSLDCDVTPILSRDSALLSKLGLRDGWKESLQALSLRGVPSFVFSSGYGDVVANALLLGGVSAASSSDAALPQNLRIISNFFRAAPDGTVRAFSQPIVHDR